MPTKTLHQATTTFRVWLTVYCSRWLHVHKQVHLSCAVNKLLTYLLSQATTPKVSQPLGMLACCTMFYACTPLHRCRFTENMRQLTKTCRPVIQNLLPRWLVTYLLLCDLWYLHDLWHCKAA